MRKLRIVFMGTPEFAVNTLAQLIENNYKVVGVITAPDRPAGRGRKIQESVVKTFAVKKGLQILQPTNLKSEVFLKTLADLKPNLQIIVAFRMLPKVVWNLPEYGTFNLHASLLPQYRGAAPINWAIMNGETETGVTTFFIDDKIDTGEIILQETVPITEKDTAGSLHDKLMQFGADLVLTTVQHIEKDDVQTQQQKESKDLKSAYKIYKDTCKIDWQKPIHEIYNHIRGLSPYPGAWTSLKNGSNNLLLKIYNATIEKSSHDFEIGMIIATKSEIKIAVAEGYVNLLEIQLPGKRKMKSKEVLNGFKLEKTAQVL